MPSAHFLNVSPGDCTLIQHLSGRITMIDICDGNLETKRAPISIREIIEQRVDETSRRNRCRMCEKNTNPIEYARALGLAHIHRFILTHPDMDHLDGFHRLVDEFSLSNFWDSGARKSMKPEFGWRSPYLEEDWNRYAKVRDGKEGGVKSIVAREGARFQFANKAENGSDGGDGLYILSPNDALLSDLNEDDDLNDASYVILYKSLGGSIILPGDAHDAAWTHTINHHRHDVQNCSFLLAPHHGRDSDRDYSFLDVLRPNLTLIGCSPSDYIEYDQWHRRGLEFITSNQAGNVVVDILDGSLDVYVENEAFAKSKYPKNAEVKNRQGYSGYCKLIPAVAHGSAAAR